MMTHGFIQPTTSALRRHRRGFSITELILVVGIIVALIGILTVALSSASRRAQAANTQFFLSSISQALVRFEGDMGYLPPVLGRSLAGPPSSGVGLGRDLVQPPLWAVVPATGLPTAASVNDLQNWYSLTSLPEYLLGYGDRFADGYGVMGSASAATGYGAVEQPRLGIRTPGSDGVWGALMNPIPTGGLGRFVSRNNTGAVAGNNSAGNDALIQGRVYGPYLDLKETENIAGITGFDLDGEPILVRPGDEGYGDDLPKVFVDYWGSPIQYYRKAYAFLDLKGPDLLPPVTPGVRPVMRDLGDIFALRPADFRPGEEATGVADAANDTATLTRLKAARWALLSRGPNKNWDRTQRRDEEELNVDNIVEAGQ